MDILNYKEINENLLKHVLEEQKRDKGIIRSNSLGWHSDISMMKRDEFADIRNVCYDVIIEISELLDLDMENYKLQCRYWQNADT